jgi:peptide/nickel transport system substrate-binding protein
MHTPDAPDGTARYLNRRRFLGIAAASAGAAVLAACGGGTTAPTATTAAPAGTPTRPPTQAAGARDVGTVAPTAATSSSPAGTAAAAPASAVVAAPATSAPTIQAAAAGKAGGTKIYRVGVASEINEFDPPRSTTQVNNAPSEALYSYPMRYTYTPPLGTTINPDVIESWDIQDGAKTFLFHVRKGVKYHGGFGEVTADDIKWNWDRVKDPATASSAAPDWKGSTTTVLDPSTIKVVFDHPYPGFINATLAYTSGMLVCPKAFQQLGDKWNTHPIGSGAFVWDSYQAGTSMTLKRNPDYWGKVPHIDQIDFRMKVDDRTALLAVSKGEIDSFYVSDPDVAISASKSTDPNVRFIKSAFGQSPFIVWFNMRRKPMDDPRVRQALRYAIDTNAIAKDLFGGLAQPISSFLPPWVFGFSDNVTHYDYNPDKARQLLKDANVSPDWQPEMISQSILTISRRVTEAVASYWTDAGIKIKNSSLEQGIITKRSADRDFDMYATYVSRVDPDQLTNRFWRSTGASNMSGYTGADDLIDKIAVETDLPTRASLYRDLQDKISQDAPAAFTVAVSEHLLLNKRVVGEQGPGWLERHNWFDVDVPAE